MDPEGTAGVRGKGWVGRGLMSETLKASRRWEMGRGFSLSSRLGSLGSDLSSPSAVQGGFLAENRFQCFPSITEMRRPPPAPLKL